jgi:hypothetical protein
MTTYKKNSPYYNTDLGKGYLDVATFRNIPSVKGDVLFTVTNEYEHRPDLLAFDLYNDPGLWWVFAVRNKSIIKDPIYDLVAGIEIYLPQETTLKNFLGI